MKIEVSNSEIVDRVTILKIKLERIKDKDKLKNIRKEYNQLNKISSSILKPSHHLFKELYKANCLIWYLEEKIRNLEKKKEFGKEFISIARRIYPANNKRSQLKREINQLTSSKLIDEKSYKLK